MSVAAHLAHLEADAPRLRRLRDEAGLADGLRQAVRFALTARIGRLGPGIPDEDAGAS